MTLNDVLRDIHALEDDIGTYERKYGVLSETFYESYMSGEEPAEDAWVLDWNDWAGAYELWLRRREQYQTMVQALKKQTSLAEVIKRAAHREPFSISA